MSAVFRCFSGCAGTFPLTQAIYSCPTCGGLLEVHHDLTALQKRTAAEWKSLFRDRQLETLLPFASGVWSKKEWVMPDLPVERIVSTGEGRSPLLHAARFGSQIGVSSLWIKQCGASHTGSFKDLGMTVLVSVVSHAMAEKKISPRALACASTGDTSAALAAYGSLAGLPVVVLLPKGKVSTAQLLQPLAHGAKVLALQTDFDGCMAIIKELAKRDLIYLANSMNPLRVEGQKTVAFEIAEQFGWRVPDWVVLPSGNLGNASALFAGFSMMKELGVIDRLPRLAIAQSKNANPMVKAFETGSTSVTPIAASRTHASAIQIGNPVSAPRAFAALSKMNGVAVDASEEELAEAAAAADRTGLYACPHTAVALACTATLRRRNVIKESEQVVVISTANALKFTEFKVGYHERTLEGARFDLANAPLELPADVDAVVRAIAS